ncbi:hypothetical protein TNCV_3651561 [Trichonephila clavipes]|uniref:Uncharacterized protein n=1 Tax=Trichonephila clavipes TaxID=2585209 RepID=A0A8X6VGD6_TRICX|nr:hypothetical protein TNCV_3651561 [Trichonephila clavipes]
MRNQDCMAVGVGAPNLKLQHGFALTLPSHPKKNALDLYTKVGLVGDPFVEFGAYVTVKGPGPQNPLGPAASKSLKMSLRLLRPAKYLKNALDPGWALSRSRSTGEPPRHFGVTALTKT